jgi:hypothetical protein
LYTATASAFFGAILANHVLVKRAAQLMRRGQRRALALTRLARGGRGDLLFMQNVVAQLDAFVADIYLRALNQLFDFMLTLAAERAVQQLVAGFIVRHHLIR